MSKLLLEIPDDVYAELSTAAERNGASVEELVLEGATAKLKALKQLEILRRFAAGGSVGHFHQILDQVPDVPPMPGDELPEGWPLPARLTAKGQG